MDLAFTDRHGGVSHAPFDSLNLALTGPDPEASRAENLRLVLADFAPGAVLADLRQVHGDTVHVVAGRTTPGATPPDADGIVTAEPDVVLMVRAADCVPVLLADAAAGVVGAAHAGRLGLAAGVVLRTVERMRELGAAEVTAWVGPHVCGACYEVPAELQRRGRRGRAGQRRHHLVGHALPRPRGRACVPSSRTPGWRVVDVARCTRESRDLYSFRRDGEQAGRLAGLVRLRAPGDAA